MFSKLTTANTNLANMTFGVAVVLADYGMSQEQTNQTPAATAPAQDAPILRREAFSKKYRDEIREAIANDLDTTVVVVFSVPKFCAPCREYEPELETLQKILQSEGEDRKVRIVVVDFSDFEQSAEETVVNLGGRNVVLARQVPTTMIASRLSDDLQIKMKELAPNAAAIQDSFLPATLPRPIFRFTGGAKAQELQEAIKRVEEYTDQQLNIEGRNNNAPKGPIRTVLDAGRRWLGFSN